MAMVNMLMATRRRFAHLQEDTRADAAGTSRQAEDTPEAKPADEFPPPESARAVKVAVFSRERITKGVGE